MRTKWIALFFTGLCGLGCGNGDLVSGPCEYSETKGTATIVSVLAASSNVCPRGAMRVTFDFRPDDPKAASRYRFPGWSDADRRLTVGEGIDPPAEWVAKLGITAGQQYRAVRMEETSGSCTPVSHELTGIDTSGWVAYCQ